MSEKRIAVNLVNGADGNPVSFDAKSVFKATTIQADKQAQAQRIHDYYRAVGDALISQAHETDYENASFLKRVAGVQRRKAFAGRVLKIGLYE